MTCVLNTGQYELELRNEEAYTLRSSDNARVYDHEYVLCRGEQPSSRHGLACRAAGTERTLGSAIMLAGRGASGVHARSLVVHESIVYVAVGDHIVALHLPALTLAWKAEADPATVFGVYLSPAKDALLVHGELEVSRMTLSGDRVWASSGADIFTGEFSVLDTSVRISDFDGRWYTFDVETGELRA
jgi:hypothetical protein